MHVFLQKSPLCRSHFFEWLKTAISSNACGMSTLKSLLPQAFAVSDVHPRLRKRLARCTLDCGFKTPESPALRGFVAGLRTLATAALYLVLKSNGLRHLKNLPVKFGFSLKTVPANIAQKLPPQVPSQTIFHHDFQLLAQTAHVRFHGRKWVHTRLSEKDRTQRLTHRSRGLPFLDTAGLCVTSEISLITAFVTIDSTVLLYTYISQFSVAPHYQQQLYLRPSLVVFFNFSHKRPTFAFTPESGYTLAFQRKIAHKGTHAETGGVSDGALSLPSTRAARSRTSPGRVSERQTLPLLGLGRAYARRTQKAFGTAMRSCVSLFRGVAAPLGCVIFFASAEVAARMPCAQGLSVCARRGVVSLPSAHFTCC